MSEINVINNAGTEFNITVNGKNDNLEIIIDKVREFKLPKNLKSGDVFKDADGDEYILLYYTEDGNAAVITKENIHIMAFGKNNNYDGCEIDNYLCNEYLSKLERKFGAENLIEHEVDLLSLDGEDDYGKINRKVSLLTFDRYRKNKKAIKSHIEDWFWLSTPNSTPSGYVSSYVQFVYSSGNVDYNWYNRNRGVRPFFILKREEDEK